MRKSALGVSKQTLRKHAHVIMYTDFSEVVKIENFQSNFFDIFLIFALNIDCFGAKIR